MIDVSGKNIYETNANFTRVVRLDGGRHLQSWLTVATDAPLFQPGLELVLIEQHHARTRSTIPWDVLPLIQARAGHPKELSGLG
jgi:hypothetical protein